MKLSGGSARDRRALAVAACDRVYALRGKLVRSCPDYADGMATSGLAGVSSGGPRLSGPPRPGARGSIGADLRNTLI
jgi:hypothetical protein